MDRITGNQDGMNGRNESYKIGSRTHVPRWQAVMEVKQGLHPNYHIMVREGIEYLRDNPDGSKKDNVNR